MRQSTAIKKKKSKRGRKRKQKTVIGWREFASFPDLSIDLIKAKIDTGARSSAIHAWNIKPIEVDGAPWVSFDLHPVQRNNRISVSCAAPLVTRRTITSSSGHQETRFVIKTTLQLGQTRYPIELTLTNRDTMGFRLLLGRTSVRGRFLVDPGKSFLLSGGKSGNRAADAPISTPPKEEISQ